MPEQTNILSRFIWADKVILGLALFAAFVWAAAWWTAFLVIGDKGATYLWLHLGARWTDIGILSLMSAWLLLRALDFAALGVTFRLVRQTMVGVDEMFARATRAATRFAPHHGAQIAR